MNDARLSDDWIRRLNTLQLLLGDANHVPHDPPVMSRRITIQVRGSRPAAVAATR